MDSMEADIQKEVEFIESHQPDDYNIISSYRDYKGRYEYNVREGVGAEEPIRSYYIRKEAYRRIAHSRGYTDDAMLNGCEK